MVSHHEASHIFCPLSLTTVKKTNLVVGNKISLFRLSSKTKFVVDNKVCRGRQSLSLATMLVVSDEPKLYIVIAAARPSSQSYFVNIPPLQRKVCNPL